MTNRYTLEYWKDQLDEIWLDRAKMIHKGKNIDEIINYAFMDLISRDEAFVKRAEASDFKRLVNSWLSNRKPEKKFVKRDISKL